MSSSLCSKAIATAPASHLQEREIRALSLSHRVTLTRLVFLTGLWSVHCPLTLVLLDPFLGCLCCLDSVGLPAHPVAGEAQEPWKCARAPRRLGRRQSLHLPNVGLCRFWPPFGPARSLAGPVLGHTGASISHAAASQTTPATLWTLFLFLSCDLSEE